MSRQKKINEKLIAARLAKHWTQEQACEHLDVPNVRTWQRWETEGTIPSPYFRMRLCEAFNMSFDELFGDEHIGISTRVPSVEEIDTHPLEEKQTYIDSDLVSIAVMALVLHQQQYQGDINELSMRVKQELEEKVPHMQKGQDIPRRDALKLIARMPLAMYSVTKMSSLLPSSLASEEVLPLYAAGIPACWRLYYEGGQQELESTLPNYLSQLTLLVEASSKHQKSAASLLSQAHQLRALLVQRHENFGEAIEACKQAFTYGQLAGDTNLQAMALIRKQDTLYENKRFAQWLLTLQEAERFADTITPLLKGRIYARLAFAYAHQSEPKLADRYIGLAEDTFPNNPEADISFLYNYTTHFILYANKALSYIEMAKARDAWDALKMASKFVLGATNPRNIDVLQYQTQAATAMKDLELSCTLFEKLTQLLTQFGEEIDVGNTHDIYQQIISTWPHEKKVQHLKQFLHA